MHRTIASHALGHLPPRPGGAWRHSYDPLGRLYETSGGAQGVTRFLYDGDELVAEYDGSGNLLRRYVHGAGVDDPLVWYEGSSLASRRYLQSDHQGSIASVANDAGTALAINGYDAWGIPGTSNLGRFQYTGQIMLPELGFYHYKARIYSPTLGRFLQTDPIGYDDQINLYAYVGNDPINRKDPTGKAGIVGAIGGALFEVALQKASGKDWGEIDLGDVAISAVQGATGLGALAKGVQAYKAIRMAKAARAAAQPAVRYQANVQARGAGARVQRNAERRAQAAEQRAEQARDAARRGAAEAVGAVVGGKAAKEATPEITPLDVGRGVEKIKRRLQDG